MASFHCAIKRDYFIISLTHAHSRTHTPTTKKQTKDYWTRTKKGSEHNTKIVEHKRLAVCNRHFLFTAVLCCAVW